MKLPGKDILNLTQIVNYWGDDDVEPEEWLAERLGIEWEKIAGDDPDYERKANNRCLKVYNEVGDHLIEVDFRGNFKLNSSCYARWAEEAEEE